ncbi:MAG: M23 family metallopeptidase [Cognatishimia sp.]
MPGNAPSITQQYRNPENRRFDSGSSPHLGIDVHAPIGTPVLAAAGGVVLRSYWGPAYGNQIEIEHPADSSGKTSRTRYVHLDKRLVREGDQVQRGAEIGHLGITGFLSSGFPHLHFEVLYRGTSILGSATDPHRFWAKGRGKITCFGPEWVGLSSEEFKLTYPVECK